MFHPAIHKDLIRKRYRRTVESAKVPLIIDCGANIGVSSLWFAAQYPGSKIVAIEPDAENVKILRKNLDSFQNKTGRVEFEIVEGGIGDRDCEMSLIDCGYGEMGFRTLNETGGVRVKMHSLGQLLRRFQGPNTEPFILKADIEGSEKLLFSQPSWPFLDLFPLIILEEHDFMMPGKSTASEFFRFQSDRQRDFMFGEENIFSFDYASLSRESPA